MKQKIPKKIHYCWFGGNPLPDDLKEYVATWKKYCPDYEIIEWNESNFDINSNTFVKEAYEAKKWAFVSDYVRLYALYNFGGVYMDTDVELVANIDKFLEHDAFSGFESTNYVPTGIMACKKGFELFKEFLDFYNDRHFINEDGSCELTSNVFMMTDICKKYGLKLNDTYQVIEGFVLYPHDVFCPKISEIEMDITENTAAIHHFKGSWLSSKAVARMELRKKLLTKYGEFWGWKVMYNTIYMPYRIISNISERLE